MENEKYKKEGKKEGRKTKTETGQNEESEDQTRKPKTLRYTGRRQPTRYHSTVPLSASRSTKIDSINYFVFRHSLARHC